MQGGSLMKYESAFEIIGPVMVGPSSSHTAGAVRIGNIARQMCPFEPAVVRFELMAPSPKRIKDTGLI